MSKTNERLLLDLYADIGRTVLLCQVVEFHLKTVIDYALDDDSERWKKLLQGNPDRRTLGKLVEALQAKITLNDDFLSLVASFHERRNILVHTMIRHEGSNLYDAQGILRAQEYVTLLHKDAVTIMNILYRVIHALKANLAQPISREMAKNLLSLQTHEDAIPS